ncbi:sulfurtransferase [Pedobacter sp. ASV28]|uniref:sulfurtransferase n=1 Tax=Pedobacter sp. ASV28 TaxID=2795123 RepID=UPI0018ECD634|nr:sulfurtransferase [Pedobacter sp. ASV28]
MTEHISPIIQATELITLTGTNNLVIVEASNGKNAKDNYEKKHLAGALFMELNTQLADIKEDLSNGGRHPLPTIEKFAKTLSSFGISTNSHVVVYDHNNGSNAAARFWWMLKSVGHPKVQVLNGGFQAAEKIGFPINATIEMPKPTAPYQIENWRLPLADMAEVEKVSQDKDHIVIDVRDEDRYNGDIEPIDPIAGHIPGAINVPFMENLDKDGLFLQPAALKMKYEKIFGDIKNTHIIVHCGSGVTACHSLLAIAYAGLDIPKLYVGSWSEWSRNHKTIATKKNED